MAPDEQALAKAFKTLADALIQHHGFSKKDLHTILDQQEASISAYAFAAPLTPLEVLVRHNDISSLARMIQRPRHTLEAALRNSEKKQPGKISVAKQEPLIPLSIFADATLSIQEHICEHLHKRGLKNKEIASIIGSDQRVVATVLARAKKKRGERR